MIRAIVMALVIACILSGCSDYKMKQQAKEGALAELKDADSAKFKSVKIVTENGKQAVCMSINAKNGYGAYGGYKWALWRPGVDGRDPRVMWEGQEPPASDAGFFRAAGVDIVAARVEYLHSLCGTP